MAVPVSVRERILRKFILNFEAVQNGTDEHVITWNTVTREPIEDIEQQTDSCMIITEGIETADDDIGLVRKSLEIATEFWVHTMVGDDKSELANAVLADVIRTVRADSNLIEADGTCLATDVVEASNELELNQETLVGGVVVWRVKYRHDQIDPRSIGRIS